MRIFLRVLGGCMMAIGATFVALAVTEMATGGDGHTTPGVYAMLVVFFGALAFGGWRVWRATPAPLTRVSVQGLPPELSPFEVEQAILASAARLNGRVTVGEVAMACRIPIARAKQTLEEMVMAGAAEMLLTDGGDPVYRIAGLLAAADKDGATDPLEDVLPGARR